MSGQTGTRSGEYLYAVIAASEERTLGSIGIGGADVYTVCEGGVAAVVSHLIGGRVRPERRNLAAHQDVLKQLMGERALLPMSFGIVAESHKAIRGILLRNRDALLTQLRRVEGRVEMGLRVTWDAPNIFEHFVLTHPELRAARDQMVAGRREPTQDEKIELGALFDRALNDDRESYTRMVEQALSGCCAAVKWNKCRGERDVMNLACLVDRQAQAQFEAGVLTAASNFDDSFAFDYNGPWAPHNFVEVELKL